MSGIGEGLLQEADGAAADRSGEPRVSFLDQALWKHFSEAKSPAAFARSWLALQCGIVVGVRNAVVVLGDPDEGPYAPAASWPNDDSAALLVGIAEVAMRERRGIVHGLDDEAGQAASQRCQVAHPFVIDGRLYGVVALDLQPRKRADLRGVMRQLQWGAGWIEVMLRREELRGNRAQAERIAAAFDLAAVALEAVGFKAACTGVVTELATRFRCELVSIGFRRRGRTVILALSHAAHFGERMNLMRDIGLAMDEAIDQQAVVVHPPPEGFEYRTVRAHAELARSHGIGTILTVPLHRSGQLVGAITLERPAGSAFDDETIEMCDAMAGVLGPVLDEKRLNDRLMIWKAADSLVQQLKRLIGPRHYGRKLAAALALGAVAFFSIVKDVHRITSPMTVEGTIQRVIVAPFDSYVASQQARAGDVVRAGDVLATLDDRDLVLERLRWSSQHRERMVRYQKAMADGQRAEAKVIQAQIEEAVAQLALLDAQLERTRIRAPFGGMVIAGDLSQLVGSAVRRGDQLFKIAPLDSYRLVLEVDESDIADLRVGQRGTTVVSALPNEPIPYTIQLITPITEAKDGRNAYRVEARIERSSEKLRPGMGGIAKTDTEDRLLIRIWTQRLVDWARLFAWRWIP
jgi:RND family efflux transporter MFP subunit